MKIIQNFVKTLILITVCSTSAQQGINYKALIKDNDSNVVANQIIDIQFIIYPGPGETTNVYQEIYSSIMTDNNVIAIVNIGQGTTSDDFSAINCGLDNHYLNIQIDTGSGLTDMGAIQFMAVPYALSALLSIDDLKDAQSNDFSIFIGVDAGAIDSGSIASAGVGFEALAYNATGDLNTAVGGQALFNNTGSHNTANGFGALYNNTTGYGNTAIGQGTLYDNTIGSNNAAIGTNAQVPDGTLNNQVRIGDEYVTYAGVQVAWDVTSDRRWKEDIRELPYGLDIVKMLRPVDYIRKNNEHQTRETGFIGQDVEALLTELGYNDQGLLHKDDKGYISLRYNDFIAILTKAIQDQQNIIEKQNAALEGQELKIEIQNKNYEKLLKRVEQFELASNQ